jgi:hypothetical protein
VMAVELPITVTIDQNEAAEVLARHVMRKLGVERATGFGVKISPERDGAWSVAVTLNPPA